MKKLSDKKEPSLAFGGQALIEGVMIRSRSHLVMCVRKPNQEILTNVEEVQSLSQKHKSLGVPFIRGIVALPETLYLGFKGLFFSANAAIEEEGKEAEEQEQFGYKEFAVAVALAIGIAALFFVVPFLLRHLAQPDWCNLQHRRSHHSTRTLSRLFGRDCIVGRVRQSPSVPWCGAQSH